MITNISIFCKLEVWIPTSRVYIMVLFNQFWVLIAKDYHNTKIKSFSGQITGSLANLDCKQTVLPKPVDRPPVRAEISRTNLLGEYHSPIRVLLKFSYRVPLSSLGYTDSLGFWPIPGTRIVELRSLFSLLLRQQKLSRTRWSQCFSSWIPSYKSWESATNAKYSFHTEGVSDHNYLSWTPATMWVD